LPAEGLRLAVPGRQPEQSADRRAPLSGRWTKRIAFARSAAGVTRAGHEDRQERVWAGNIERYSAREQDYSDKDARISAAGKPDF